MFQKRHIFGRAVLRTAVIFEVKKYFYIGQVQEIIKKCLFILKKHRRRYEIPTTRYIRTSRNTSGSSPSPTHVQGMEAKEDRACTPGIT